MDAFGMSGASVSGQIRNSDDLPRTRLGNRPLSAKLSVKTGLALDRPLLLMSLMDLMERGANICWRAQRGLNSLAPCIKSPSIAWILHPGGR